MVPPEYHIDTGQDIRLMKPPAARKLEELGIEYRLIKLKGRAVTVQDVIDNADDHVDPAGICKTILVKHRSGSMCALLLRGSDRIAFKKLRKILGKVSVASSGDVERAAGVMPGAVCPLTLNIPICVDEKVLKLERVNFGSGDHLYGIEVHTKDLVKMIDYRTLDLAE
jgi:prolyl-tRNA editing enzyme YbaK/EbsC (Cys-tRNA(Pro) deacylase)